MANPHLLLQTSFPFAQEKPFKFYFGLLFYFRKASRREHMRVHKKGSPASSENRLFQTSDHSFLGNICFFLKS